MPKHNLNGPPLQKSELLAIFTIPYPTNPYLTCLNVLVVSCR